MKFSAPVRMRTLIAALLVSPLPALPAIGSITGVCPDGSIFIVQRADDIPCRDAKPVDPSDVPPLKPEYLPRPYGWELHHRKNDPHNPYNLIQAPRMRARDDVRGDRRSTARPSAHQVEAPVDQRIEARERFRSEPGQGTRRPTGQGAPESGPFGLGESEIRDLARIVDLSQRRAPVSILSRGSGGRLQLARSRAFESRVRERLGHAAGTSGNVVLFAADTRESGSFYANLTFVQGHVAFQPKSESPLQLGLLRGELGELRVDRPVLGYVVLPEHFDLGRPMDIYWNDQQVTATLVP